MLSLPIALSIVLAAPLAQRQQEPNRAVLEIIPMQHVCATHAAIVPPPWTTVMTRRIDDYGGVDLVGVIELSPQFDPSTIVEFLSAANEGAVDRDELHLDCEGDALIAMGTTEAVGLLKQQVRDLRDVVTRPIEVEVTFWSAETGGPGATVLSPQDYAAFAASHRPLWRRISTTRSGRPVSLESSRWNRYVCDVNVEIAKKATMSQPVADAFFEGNNVVVLPHGLVGGDDFVADVQFARAERMGPMQRVTTGIQDSPQIDAPTIGSLCGGMSGRLTNGGALCATMLGDAAGGPSAILTVRLASRIPPDATVAHKTGVFPVSAITSRAMTARVDPPSIGDHLPEVTDPNEVSVGDPEEGYGSLEQDRLIALLYSSLAEEQQETTALQIAGGHLFARGDEAMIERVETFLRGLQDRLLRTVSVQHRVAIDREAGATGAQSTAALHELSVPSLLGRYATVTRRIETLVIGNLNAEVAEESTVLDPVVGLLQYGAWMRARVVGTGDDVHLALLAQCSHCEVPAPRQIIPAGSLSLVEVASQRLTHDGLVASGQQIEHGDGPTVDIRGQQHRSASVTTVRW